MKNLILILVFIASSLIIYSQETNETVTDIDGNVYKTIKIGTQTWMLENLKTTRYNSGAPIQKLNTHYTDNGVFCWYNNDEANKDVYGALYDWWAVDKGNLAPKGWHVPSLDEWNVLIDFLGGQKIAGHKMKQQGTDFWDKPNIEADNSSGFTALPNGKRPYYDGKAGLEYTLLGEGSFFWTTSTKKGLFLNGIYIKILANSEAKRFRVSILNSFADAYNCMGIRCIKD